ncbi:MAG: nuclear transport factor 2 family protein [Acidobacteriota bacterium]
MKVFSTITLTLVAAALFAACGAPAGNAPAANNANTNSNANAAAKPVAAAPTKEALFTLEKSAWEAWKNHDDKFWATYMSDKFVGFGQNGRVDKAGEIKLFTDTKVDVKSYSFSDENMTMLGNDVAVLTFKAAQDCVVNGKACPKEVWSSSVYVRDGDKWKEVMYAENPVVDPKAPPAKPAAPAAAKKDEAKPAEAKPDTLTETLMAIETKAWEAWKVRDKAGVEGVMTKAFQYVSGLGVKNRDDSIKLWADAKCEGLDYKFSEPMGVSIAPDVSLVTYKADVKGTCDGKPVTPAVWVASFDFKEGDAWKNAFYTDLPR